MNQPIFQSNIVIMTYATFVYTRISKYVWSYNRQKIKNYADEIGLKLMFAWAKLTQSWTTLKLFYLFMREILKFG